MWVTCPNLNPLPLPFRAHFTLFRHFYDLQDKNIRQTLIKLGTLFANTEFANQIERATELGKRSIILGDANLNALKWCDEKFLHKKISEPLLNILEQCGL